MARIAGVDIPREKRTVIALTYIFGVGPTIAEQVCAATGVDESTRVKDLSEADVNKLRAYIDQNVTVEGDLRRDVATGHQAQDGDQLPAGDPSPQGTARARSAHPNERPHPQGTEAHRRR